MARGRHDLTGLLGLGSLGLLLVVATASARSVSEDPVPWYLLIEPTSLTVDVAVGDDPRSGWTSNRTGLMFRLPTGDRTRAYARWSHVAYDDAGFDATSRWNDIGMTEPLDPLIPDGEQGDTEGVRNWNVLDRHAGWNRPEFGILGPTAWPLIGEVTYAASAWLPFAANELYPYAARSISIRGALRKEFALTSIGSLALAGFVVRDMSPGGDLLADRAMTGWTGGDLSLRLIPDAVWRIEGGWSLAVSDEVDLSLLHLEAGRSLGEGLRCRLLLEHHLGDPDDRPFATRIAAVWSLALPGGEETEDERPEAP